VLEKVEGDRYEDRIKDLKEQYPAVDPDLFDILSHIQSMTSDKVHEQSWPKWDAKNLRLILETLKAVLQESYVEPQIKRERSQGSMRLREEALKPKREAQAAGDGGGAPN
jgi:hypothetical protein